MGRKKVLTQRILTYRQHRDRLGKSLYGPVRAQFEWVGTPPATYCALCLSYLPADSKQAFPIADVRRAAGDATLYVLHGIGKQRNKPAARAAIKRWMRYAPAFTPMPEGERLYEGEKRFYLVKDGTVTRLTDMPGCWPEGLGEWPRQYRSTPADLTLAAWADGAEKRFAPFTNFTRRCRRFARELRASLAEFGCEVGLKMGGTIAPRDKKYLNWQVNSLIVATPPTATQDGRRLGVEMGMYGYESRRFHHVDGDYATKNCHFLAAQSRITTGERSLLRWKCHKDAINGIREWVFGGIYIPGPD